MEQTLGAGITIVAPATIIFTTAEARISIPEELVRTPEPGGVDLDELTMKASEFCIWVELLSLERGHTQCTDQDDATLPLNSQRHDVRKIGRTMKYSSFSSAVIAFSLLGTMLASGGCFYPAQFWSAPERRAKYEAEFASRKLDPIEGFWSSQNAISSGVCVVHRIDAAENMGFEFICRTVELKTPPGRFYIHKNVGTIVSRWNPTSVPGVYRGSVPITMPLGRIAWADATIRFLDLTTAETTIHTPIQLAVSKVQRSYYVGPKEELDRRRTAVARSREAHKTGREAKEAPDSESDAVAEKVSVGTGFIVTPTLVVTSFHIIDNANSIHCYAGSHRLSAAVRAIDRENDIALLETEEAFPTNTVPLSIGESSSVKQGERVYAMGYPLTDVLGTGMRAHEGIVSSITGFGGTASQFQVEMALNPGNSGGPVIDRFGNVIGIIVSKLSLEYAVSIGQVPEGVTFAAKSDLLRLLFSSADSLPPLQFSHDRDTPKDLERIVDEHGAAIVRIEAVP